MTLLDIEEKLPTYFADGEESKFYNCEFCGCKTKEPVDCLYDKIRCPKCGKGYTEEKRREDLEVEISFSEIKLKHYKKLLELFKDGLKDPERYNIKGYEKECELKKKELEDNIKSEEYKLCLMQQGLQLKK